MEESLTQPPETVEEKVMDKALRDCLRSCLLKLPARRERIIRMRFGLGVSPKLLREIADDFGLSVDRIRQLEAKAMRELRRPLEHHKKLKTFITK